MYCTAYHCSAEDIAVERLMHYCYCLIPFRSVMNYTYKGLYTRRGRQKIHWLDQLLPDVSRACRAYVSALPCCCCCCAALIIAIRQRSYLASEPFFFCLRGGVTGRPTFIPPYWNLAFFSAGLSICEPCTLTGLCLKPVDYISPGKSIEASRRPTSSRLHCQTLL